MDRIHAYYVINLRRRPDRLAEFRSRFTGPVNVIEAIDGHALTSSPLTRRIRLRPGEIGAMLSHVRLWSTIAQDTDPCHYHLVFEDDVHFDPDFMDKWHSLYAPSIPSDVSIAFIGGRFQPHHREPHDKSRQITHHWYQSTEDRTFHAYILTPKGAKRLVDLFLDELKGGISNAVDALVNIWNAAGRLDPPAISTNELICYSPLFYKTDVQTFATKCRDV